MNKIWIVHCDFARCTRQHLTVLSFHGLFEEVMEPKPVVEIPHVGGLLLTISFWHLSNI